MWSHQGTGVCWFGTTFVKTPVCPCYASTLYGTVESFCSIEHHCLRLCTLHEPRNKEPPKAKLPACSSCNNRTHRNSKTHHMPTVAPSRSLTHRLEHLAASQRLSRALLRASIAERKPRKRRSYGQHRAKAPARTNTRMQIQGTDTKILLCTRMLFKPPPHASSTATTVTATGSPVYHLGHFLPDTAAASGDKAMCSSNRDAIHCSKKRSQQILHCQQRYSDAQEHSAHDRKELTVILLHNERKGTSGN